MGYDPHKYYEDGYCGGNELPDNLYEDRLIYPERPEQPKVEFRMNETYEEYQQRCQEAAAVQEQNHFARDCKLTITEGNVTGEAPGPPRTIGQRKE